MTIITDYMELFYKQIGIACQPPEYIVLTENVFIDNVLPKSGAGIILKAGVYINGVYQDE